MRARAMYCDGLGRRGMERAHLKESCQSLQGLMEIAYQLFEAQEQRIWARLRGPGQEMVTPRSEFVLAGNDGIQFQIVVALCVQEFQHAPTAITTVPHDIDRLSVIGWPPMGFYEREPEKVRGELPVGGPFKMAGLLRYSRVATQIVRIDTSRLEAKAGPEDRAQIGVATTRIGCEPHGVVGPHYGLVGRITRHS